MKVNSLLMKCKNIMNYLLHGEDVAVRLFKIKESVYVYTSSNF